MPTLLLADAGIWPLLIFAVVAMLLGGGRKKGARQGPTPTEGGTGGGLMSELNRALEELKRAEREARQRHEAPRQPPPGETSPQARSQPAQQQRRVVAKSITRGQAAAGSGVRGGDLIKRQVYLPKGKPAPRRTVRPVEYDPDQAFEDPTIISLERLDYDDDATQLVEARIKAAAQRDVAREDASLEEMSAAQLARRADRAPAEAIGGKAEHDAWHARRDAVTSVPAKQPAASRLSRFGGGRMRDAIVLSEILGRPVGER
jgi:hypothetical protein